MYFFDEINQILLMYAPKGLIDNKSVLWFR